MTDVTSEPVARPVYTRTLVFGLLLAAAGPVVTLVTDIISFGVDGLNSLPFVGPMLVIVLLVAGLAWRFGTWAKVIAVVIGLALLGLSAPFLIGSLSRVNSILDFLPAVLIIVGALLAVVFGIAAIVRRRDVVVETTATEQRVQTVGLVVLALLAVASAVLTYLGIEEVAEAEAAGATEVEMREFEFRPDRIAVASSDGRVVVRNVDHVIHTFTVPDLDVDVIVTPGSEGLVEIDGQAGTYVVYCEPHADMDEDDPEEAGMAATLVLE